MQLIWAKSYPFRAPVERWSPLWLHLDDTADVAALLFDRWLAPQTRDLLASAFGGDRSLARGYLRWLAGVHDIGKCTPVFAVQVPTLCDRMIGAGLPVGPFVHTDRYTLRHEIAGAAILDRWLAQHTGMGKSARRQYTDTVAGHHGSFPTTRRLRDAERRPDLMGEGPWVEAQDALLDRAIARAGIDLSTPEWGTRALPQSVQMLTTGIVVMADWIASGGTFPLADVDQVPVIPEATTRISPRAVDGLAEIRLGAPWQPRPEPVEVDNRFIDRFPWADKGPRPVQRSVMELADTMVAPGLMILEAPMGVGKTEAAFMAAEVLAARTGATGCFVALPTQATSNAMFTRMLAWLERLPDGSETGSQSVALMHGKAALNDEFQRLPFGITPQAAVHDEEAERRSRRVHAAIGEWTRGRKLSAFSSFVVGTIDQVLFTALRARHSMLRHLSFANKVVVIDEVHAADVYMSTFLDRALEWLGAEGTPVVLMSGTLPADRRAALYSAYETGRLRRIGRIEDEPAHRAAALQRLEGDIGYPSLVATGPEGPQLTTPTAGDDHRQVVLHRLDDEFDALTTLLEDRLADGGCAVVVRNTVRRAQDTARHLAAVWGEDQVTVAHASFLATDRLRTDADLLARFGPPGPDTHRPGRHVVVATQVVEQSLDVDFDLMITDVAPVDLLLQRIGRLHRHQRDSRPRRVATAECHLTGTQWSTVPPTLDRATERIYRRWPVWAGLAVLAPHLDGTPVDLPGDISPLVQAAYGPHAPVPAEWEPASTEAREKFQIDRAAQQQKAEPFTVPPVQPDGIDLYDTDRFSPGVVEEDSPQGQGFVRDSGDSIEVIVVQRGADGTDRIPDWVDNHGGEALPLRGSPVPYDLARALARCTLRLPFALTVPGVIDLVIAELEQNWFDGWGASPFLSGQLALVLDDDRSARLAGHRLTYDLGLGLVVARDDSPHSEAR